VVGSRRAAPGALLTARDIALELAATGITVVSGMARGVDAAAHRGALLGGGATIAVLGCGIDLCYPPEHIELRDQIVATGCVLSEDGGMEPPIGWRFPRRNRLIAALAEAVVVVEATARSGALSTARWAADLGREVLAVPGSIRSASSVGTNLLIRDGVRPFLDIADLFEAAARASGDNKRTANWVIGEVAPSGKSPTPDHLAEVVTLVATGKITRDQGREVLAESMNGGGSPSEIVAKRGLAQVSDPTAVRAAVEAVIAENPKAVQDYRAGKVRVLDFLVAQVLKRDRQIARSRANDLLKELLS